MEKLILFDNPLPPDDMEAIKRIVQEADLIFSPHKGCADFDFYDWFTYQQQHELYGNKTYALFDLNLTTYVINIGKRKAATAKPEHRQTAALMTLLICADILIEPGPSLTESNTSSTTKDGEKKLHWFRLADNLPASVYTDFALGRIDGIGEGMLPNAHDYQRSKIPTEVPSEFPLYRGYLLKMYQLLCDSKLGRADRIKQFWQWMWSRYQFDVVSSTYALLLFSGSIKEEISKNTPLESLEKNILNISWDFALIRNWIRRVDQQKERNEIWLLCTNDVNVRKTADMIFDDGSSDRERKRNELFRTFGSETELFCTALEQDTLNPERNIVQLQNSTLLSDEISALEKKIFG